MLDKVSNEAVSAPPNHSNGCGRCGAVHRADVCDPARASHDDRALPLRCSALLSVHVAVSIPQQVW